MAAIGALLAAVVATLATRRGARRCARSVIADPRDHTTMDARGAVRSIQGADVTLPVATLDALWTQAHFERLERTYWRHLSRCTLGLIRVLYDDAGRSVVLLARRLVLLRFTAPRFELDARRGVVRWGIARGALVARAGRDAGGSLQIAVTRREPIDAATARVHVEVEVAEFLPALASGVARWLYSATQARIHVVVTHGYLRSLARLDLSAQGRHGRPRS